MTPLDHHVLDSYLPSGLPIPVAETDGLSAPYWDGLRQERLLVQRCPDCGQWQFGPEWLCNHCHRFDPDWVEVAAEGFIYSWERVWHPSHPALKDSCPYLAIVVELPHAGRIRMIGNLLGDPLQEVAIGDQVMGVYEHHLTTQPAYSLLQWRLL
jgi:uncharacterized OB-fold protein